jgi:hypothetical protein
MGFDEKHCFGNVISCTFNEKKIQHKIFGISLLNLAPNLKFAENRQGIQGIL